MSKLNTSVADDLVNAQTATVEQIPGQQELVKDYSNTVPEVDQAVLAVQTAPKPTEQKKKQSTKKSATKKSEANTKQSGKPESNTDSKRDKVVSACMTSEQYMKLKALSTALDMSASDVICLAIDTMIDGAKLTRRQQALYDAYMIQES